MIVFPLIRRFFSRFLEDPRTQYAMNKWLMYFWVANFIAVHVVFFLASPFWQKASILYLADISVYACIGQHYTGMAASMAGLKADERHEEAQDDALEGV
jgi:hypothetical protein